MIRQTVFVIGEGTDAEGNRFAALRCRTSSTEHFVSIVYEGAEYETNLVILRMCCRELNKTLREATELGEKEATQTKIERKVSRMKSGITDAYRPFPFQSDMTVRDFILCEDDLIKAIRENSIESTVREFIRKDYENHSCFRLIVSDIVGSICGLIARTLKEKLPRMDAIVKFKVPEVTEDLTQEEQPLHWIGENQ